ncbi:MAG: primosomal protein N' [Planctomycetes bacterium]|nr:primosomal protein N' [Planctomycetota bacterium]
MTLPRFAEIALPLPLPRPLHYRVPEGLAPRITVGHRVWVPFRNGRLIGYCVGFVPFPEIAADRVKDIESLLEDEPILEGRLLELTRWIAEYYFCSWGEAIEAVLPPAVRKARPRRTITFVKLLQSADEVRARLAEGPDVKPAGDRILRYLLEAAEDVPLAEAMGRLDVTASPFHTLARRGVVALERREVESDPYKDVPIRPHPPHALTADQETALAAVLSALDCPAFRVFLLFGVTGSGKTEVYLQAIARVVAGGAQAIVLVPEIALTPQTVARFRARFERVAVLHSHLTEAERGDEWRRIRRGEAQVVIGARSAVFAPCKRLGLIVVDEEHEPSFKQENTPRYHARDVAVMRGKLENAPVLLGSATPALESYQNALSGKYALLSLPRRVEDRPLPPVEVVDLAREMHERRTVPLLSHTLEVYAREALAREEQVIFFLNRRGFATLMTCPSCHYVHRCGRCSVAMTFHKRSAIALCHYCGAETRPPTTCPDCHSKGLQFLGVGTEKIEEELKRAFAGTEVARMDSDTMRSRKSYDRVLGGLLTGDLDFVVGTQMVAKGLDFPNVTLVGVIAGDAALFLKDFRAAERTFQLVTQVAGRAGRGPRGGRVVVQAFNPTHFSLRRAVEHDYEGFAREELEHRREMGYPPFGRLARVLVLAKDEGRGRRAAEELGVALRSAVVAAAVVPAPAAGAAGAAPSPVPRVEVLGPAPCPIAKIKDRLRWHLLLKAPTPAALGRVLGAARADLRSRGSVDVVVDVDPVSLL